MSTPEELVNSANLLVEGSDTFLSSVIASLAIIMSSEIGDKTFFVAALMSTRNSPFWVWIGASSAMFIMTILSVTLGLALPNLLSRDVTSMICTVLFFIFGAMLLKDAYFHEDSEEEDEEMREAAEEVENANKKLLQKTTTAADKAKANSLMGALKAGMALPIAIQTASMCLTAEWGDRSQFATIALASSKSAVGVALGGCIGHACCSGIAVIGGKLLADSISERMVNLVGGVLFLVFGTLSAVSDF